MSHTKEPWSFWHGRVAADIDSDGAVVVCERPMPSGGKFQKQVDENFRRIAPRSLSSNWRVQAVIIDLTNSDPDTAEAATQLLQAAGYRIRGRVIQGHVLLIGVAP